MCVELCVEYAARRRGVGMALTDLQIKNLKPKEKLYRVADWGGLCIEITPSRGRHWRWRYRYHNKAQMMSLGSYPFVSLAEARRLRQEQHAILLSGKNPAREKKVKKRQASMEGIQTFKKVADEWHLSRESHMNAKYHKICGARLEQYIYPEVGAIPIAEITIPDIVHTIEIIGKDGRIETAKRMKQMMGQVFRYAQQKGLIEHNPAGDIRDVLPTTKEKHHACISMEELPGLLKSMDDYSGRETVKLALRLLALTFVRTRELIEAKWEEIDWTRREWHIPPERMKMRRPHMVPLCRQSIVILKRLRELNGTRPYVFYSPMGKTGHISNGSILMALRTMGYKNRMTGHGFRSLASTILNESGYNSDVIERQLAHQDADKIRSAYNRAQYAQKRRVMMQAYADILEGAVLLNDGESVLQSKFKVPN